MDSQVDIDIAEIKRQPGVTGVLLADKNVVGDANPAHAGLITQIAHRTDESQKAVRIQDDNDRDVLVTKSKGLVLAIYKKSVLV